MRDAVDSNQLLSRLCEPLPTAVIPIRAEAASLVEVSTFRSYSLLISFFYTKGTVPFVLRQRGLFLIAKKGEKAERPALPTWDDADLSRE